MNYHPEQTEKVQQIINDWLDEFMFSHYFTIKVPLGAYKSGFDGSYKILRKIVKRYEKELVGRYWHKNPVHFIGIAELGERKIWHWHLLLWGHKYTDEQLQTALIKTRDYMELSENTLDIRPITYTPSRLNGYNTKEIIADNHGRFNTDRIICSDIIFDLPD